MAGAGRQTHNRRNSTAREGAKILPFRRELTINLGVIIFLFILLYLAASIIRSATRESYSVYTVGREESLNGNQTYRALILRNEQVVSSRWAGYVDMFAPESGHVSIGSVVTSVDEIGTYSEKIKEVAELQSLSREELRTFKTRLQKLALSYDGASFSSVYESRGAISAFFSTHIGKASLDVLEGNAALNEFFHLYKSDTPGMILYYKDGFESRRPEDITAADFENSDYQRDNTANLVTPGDFLYKLVDSENWTLVIPLSAEDAAKYGSQSRIDLTFLKNGLKTTADAGIFNGPDGSILLRLDLSRYMVQFATDRFTEVRLEGFGSEGYKIPVSCRVEESVYLIPREFETVKEDGTPDGFYQETVNGSEQTIRHIMPTVYLRDEKYCYVSRQDLPAESVLIRQDSQERYTIRLTSRMTGVYQVNAGYTVFSPVEILEESADYLLVRRGTEQGIATFDQVLLNGAQYTDGQILR